MGSVDAKTQDSLAGNTAGPPVQDPRVVGGIGDATASFFHNLFGGGAGSGDTPSKFHLTHAPSHVSPDAAADQPSIQRSLSSHGATGGNAALGTSDNSVHIFGHVAGAIRDFFNDLFGGGAGSGDAPSRFHVTHASSHVSPDARADQLSIQDILAGNAPPGTNDSGVGANVPGVPDSGRQDAATLQDAAALGGQSLVFTPSVQEVAGAGTAGSQQHHGSGGGHDMFFMPPVQDAATAGAPGDHFTVGPGGHDLSSFGVAGGFDATSLAGGFDLTSFAGGVDLTSLAGGLDLSSLAGGIDPTSLGGPGGFAGGQTGGSN
jgi:hypothetical protein